MGTPMQLPLDCLDGRGLQTRAAMSEETIEEYAEVCGVSERTVNRFRSEVSTCDNVAGGDEPAARIGRDGRTTHVPAAADALPKTLRR